MQEKVVYDTSVYINIFNRGLYRDEINWFSKVMYLVHPVLHELWMGAKGKQEVRHLVQFGGMFIKLGRLVHAESSTQVLIGRVCRQMRYAGKLDPKNPRQYKDVCIALLARQIGATVVTLDTADFMRIRGIVDFKLREPLG